MRNSYKFLLLSIVFCTNILFASTKNDSTTIKPLVTSSSKIAVIPVINVTASLTTFNACLGSASATQTFTVGGTGLSNNDITINAPTGYEISLNGTLGWSTTTLILTPSGGGNVASTIIYIRIASSTTSITNGITIQITSTGAITQTITVNGNINALPTITGSDNVCDNSSITLTGSPTAASLNSWVSSSPSVATVIAGVVSGVSPGQATITYTNSNGCAKTKDITVNALPTISGPSNVCVGATISLTGSTTAASSNAWVSSVPAVATINAGVVTGVSAGQTTITYTNSNGCVKTKVITVNNITVNAGNDVITCKGQIINLAAAITGASQTVSYQWSGPNGFNSNSQFVTINNALPAMAGDYTVTVIDNNGCQAIDTVNVQVLSVGVINPALLNGCVTQSNPNPIAAMLLALPSNTSIISTITVNWGDGNTETIPFPWTALITHNYSIGNYNVTITTTSTTNCSSSTSYTSFIGSSPQAATLSLFANQSTGCVPHSTQFTFGIPINNSNGTNYHICFGDNSSCIDYIGGDPIPSSWISSGTISGFNFYTIMHSYTVTSCGNSVNLNGVLYNNVYLPSVITTNPCAAPQPQAGSLISVGVAPIANFTPNPLPNICTNSALILTNTSNLGVTIDPVSFTCAQTAPLYWTISPATTGLWTATGLGSNNNYPNNESYWSVGSNNPSITFLQPGTYTITLFVKNPCGLSQISKQVCVESPTAPQFTLNTTAGCTPLAVAATNTTNLSNVCSTLTYAWEVTYASGYCGSGTAVWNYTNNTTAASPSPSFNFVTPGTYSIKVTISGSTCGTVTSAIQTVIVKKPPTVAINAISDYCGTATVSPTAVVNGCSNITLNNPTYGWSFPGATTVPSGATNAISPTGIVYSIPGTYTVTLAVTNECGTSTDTKSFTVKPLPTATISGGTTICQNATAPTITFVATSNSAVAPYTTTPPYIFTYNINSAIPNLTVTAASTNTATVSAPTATAGTFIYNLVSVQYSTLPACSQPQTGSATVIVNPTGQVNQPTDVVYCTANTTVAIPFSTSNTIGTTTYAWTNSAPSIGLGASGTGTIPSFTATNTGTAPVVATITVTPTFTFGSVSCPGPAKTFTITVNPLGQVTQPADVVYCNANTTVAIPFATTNTIGTTTYAWTNSAPSIGLGASGTGSIPSFNATNTGTAPLIATITVTPTFINGSVSCAGLAKTFTIKVNPTGQVNQPTDVVYCTANTTTAISFATTNTVGTTTYAWTNSAPSIGLGASGTGTIPSFTATNTGTAPLVATITVTPTFTNGSVSCAGVAKTLTITVNPTGQVTQPADVVYCNANTTVAIPFATTNTVGTTTYAWNNSAPSIGLSAGGIGSIPSFTATNTGTAPVIATITVTPTFTNGSVSCAGVAKTFTFTVNPTGQVTQPTNVVYCNANTTVAIPFATTNTVGTTTYAWTNSAPSIGLGASGTGTIPSFNATNTGTAPIVATITVTPTFTNGSVGCTGAAKTFTIIVNPTGQVTQPADVVYCNANTTVAIPFLTTNTVGTTTYAWTNSAPSIGLGASGTGTIPSFNATNTGTAPIIATITVIPTFTNGSVSCAGVAKTFTITVNPIPTVNAQPTALQTVCFGATVSDYTVSFSNGYGTPTYQWYTNFTGSTSVGTAVGTNSASYSPPTFNTAGDYFYYAVITFSGSGCGNITSTIAKVHVVADPTVTIIPSTQTICQNTTSQNLNVVVSAGEGISHYQWYKVGTPALAVGTDSPNFTPPTNIVETASYYCVITQTGLGCSVTSSTVNVEVVAAPAVSTQPLATQTVCLNGAPTSLTIALSNGTGTPTYQWYSNTTNSTSGSTAIAIATGLTYVPPTSATGTLYYYCIATYTSGGCTTAMSNIATVIVNPIPTVNAQPTPLQTICIGGSVPAYTVSYSNGYGTASYQWYTNTTGSTSVGTAVGTNSSTYTPPTFNTAGDYYYYAVITLSGSGCGNITSAIAQVNVVVDPTVTITPSTQTICQGATPTNLVVTPTGGLGTFSYQWYNSTSGTLLTGAINATYIPDTTSVGTISYYCVITQTGLGCSVTSSTVSVQVVAAPGLSTQPLATQTVCLNGAPTSLTVAYNNGTGTPTYQWYVVGTPNTTVGINSSTYTPPTNALGSASYYCVISFSSGGCSSATSNTAIVIVNPIPTVNAQPTPLQTICIGGSVPAYTVSYSNGYGTASYQWYTNTTGSTSVGTAVGTNSSTYTPPTFNTAGDYYYYAVITLSGLGCGNITSAIAQVNVVADPTVTITPSTQTICQGTTPANLVVTPTGGLGTFTYQWYSNTTNSTSGGSIISGVTATNASYTPVTTALGTIYYYCVVTQTGLGCSVTSSAVSVEVVAAPIVSTQPLATQTVCLNGAPTSLTIALSNGTGTPTYQWYSNTTNSTSGSAAIAIATGLAYVPPTSATGTLYYYCIATYASGGCTTAMSNIATVIVNPIPTVNAQPTPLQTICIGGSVPAYTVSYSNGYGTASYQWYTNTTASTSVGTAVGSDSSNYTPLTFNTAGDYYYYAVITLSGSGCGNITSAIAQVHVVADPTVTITPSAQTLCQDTTSQDLNVVVSGGEGTSHYQWYKVGTPALAVGTDSANFTPPTNVVGTFSYYCVVTQTGSGCLTSSATVQVIVVAAPAVSTQPLSTQTVCLNGAPTSLTVAYNNGTGTPTYQWYMVGTPNTTVGTNSSTYTPPTNAIGSASYYCVISFSSGGCSSATSNTAIVIVNPIPTVNAQPTPLQTICIGGSVPAYTVSYSNGYGTASYQWYTNTSGSTTIGTAVGSNSSTYTPLTFNTAGDYYYYAVITLSGSGCGNITSAIAQVHVVADPTVTITPSTQTICQGTAPANLVVTPTGGVGAFSYQWYNSTSGTLITGAINATYIPDTTSVGTISYYCVITQTGLGCSVTSSTVSVQVVAAPAVNVQPLATQTVCLNGAPTPLAITLINGTGTPTYQWYSNGTPNFTGTAITSATGLTYVPPTSATGTLYYYCIATYPNGGCGSAISNIAEVIVNPIQTITTQPLATQDICVGGTIAALTVEYTGGVGTATYQWYNPVGIIISGATTSSYTPATFTSAGDYSYYAMVTLSGSGCGSVSSTTALVHVVTDPTVTITPASQTICQGTAPTDLVVTPTGGVGTYNYQWYSNTTSNISTGTIVSGATSPIFTPLNSVVGITYYYCVITQTGLGCSVTSIATQVTVVAVPTISVQPIATQIICQNEPTTVLSVSVINGTGIPTYQWFSNTIQAFGGTLIPFATNATYLPSSAITGTTYFYCEIQYANGGCGSLRSNISEVEIDSVAFIPNKTALICSGETFNILPSGSVFPEIAPPGTQYIWFVDPMSSPLVTGASDNLSPPFPSISQTLNNNDTVPHNVVYHVTPITGSCQGAPFTITITINPKVIPNEVIENVQCNSFPPLCDGSITLNPTPTGTGVFTYQWSIPGTTTTQTNLCPGNYFINITDSYSCTYNFPYTVTVPPAMISVPSVNPVNNTNCDIPTSCNGIIQVVITGGTPFASATNPYQFQWYEVVLGNNIPITNSLTQVNTSILQNLCGGTYLLVVTDGVNCQRQFGPYTITNPGPLAVTSTVSNYNGFEVSCNGGNNGSIGINVTGGINSGISITLNPGGVTLPNPAIFSGLSAGSYTAVIHDSMNNCPDILRTFVLTQPATPVSATLQVVTQALCFGNQAIYQAIPSGGTGGYTFLWSNGITTPVVSNIPVGAFNCIITDSNGCQFTLNGTNTPPPLLVATATVTTPIVCFGGTASISVSGTGGTPSSNLPGYFGDIGIHTGVPAGMSPIYTITDVNGCQATVSIPVTEPALLQVTAVIATPVACFGGNAIVTVSAIGGVPSYVGTGMVSVSAGINSFIVTDSNGCIKTAQLNVTQPTLLVATASVTSPILCNGNTGVITVSGSGGTPFNTLPLYSGTGPITVIAGVGGPYTISDANGCSAITAPITVTEPSQVIATATITSPILCKGGTAVVMVSATGGVVGTGYTGTGNYVVPAGVFNYIVKDSNNCVSSVTITVTEPTLLVANAVITAPILCHGGTATISVFGTGGTPAYSGNIGNHTVVAGTYTYNVLDSNGCFATTTITVTQPALLTFSIKSVTNPNCYPIRLYNNGSICITITGGTSPVPVGAGWVQSTTIPSEWCLSGLSAGPYTISVTDINNCITASQTVALTRPTPLTAFATSNVNVNCPIKEVSQTNYVFANGGVPGYSYSWSGGNTCIPVNPQCMTTAVNGNYSAFVNDQEGLALGCIAVQVPIIVNLPVIGNPLMSISSNSGTICGNFAVNDPVTLTNISTGNYTSVQWSIDGIPLGITNSLIHNFTTIGNHTITLVVNYAIGGVTCTYSVTETIAITKGYEMIVPNGFTPGNHDAINDTIKPEFNCMGVVEMQVYDTWGSLLYAESGTSLVGWDGTVNGHESENGNYIIVVKATTLFGAEINYNGPFTLLK